MKTKEATIKLLRQEYDRNPIAQQLARLFETEPQEKVPDDPERYAIAVQILFKSGQGTAGALSIDESGMLCMAQPAAMQNPNARTAPPVPFIAFHYFMPDAIQAIVVMKPVKVEKTPVIHMGS